MIKFLFYILMKKKEKPIIDDEMQAILDENNYTPLEEWREENGSKINNKNNKN